MVMLVEQIRAGLRAVAEPDRAPQMQAYMRSTTLSRRSPPAGAAAGP